MEQYTIERICSFEECQTFVNGFFSDPIFSDPMLSNEEQIKNNLLKAIEKTEHHTVLGIYHTGTLTGVFAFLALEDEAYLEMIVGLSRNEGAYDALFACLERKYPGYQADFVFNPNNHLLRKMLQARSAQFETEQQKMLLRTPVTDVDTTGVELLSEKYTQQYCAIHNKDMYWTGEKVIMAPDRFRTLLAVEDGVVVGYLDVTHCFEENEPFDLFVRKDKRRKGYGRKLLAKSLEMNQPNGMMLLVDVDNNAAIRLYESMGFEKARNQNSQTAHWNIPAKEA